MRCNCCLELHGVHSRQSPDFGLIQRHHSSLGVSGGGSGEQLVAHVMQLCAVIRHYGSLPYLTVSATERCPSLWVKSIHTPAPK